MSIQHALLSAVGIQNSRGFVVIRLNRTPFIWVLGGVGVAQRHLAEIVRVKVTITSDILEYVVQMTQPLLQLWILSTLPICSLSGHILTAFDLNLLQ